MQNIKIKEIDEKKINDLLKITEPACISVDSHGIKKDMVYFIDNLLSEKDDFIIDISTEKNDSPDYISGIDIIPQIPNVRNIRVQATLKYPLDNLNIFSKVIDLRKIDIYGNITKGIILDPLKNFDNLESVKIENGLTLRQQTFLESIKSLRCLDVAEFNALSFNRNKFIKTLKVNLKLTGIDSLPRVLPELESICLDQCRSLGDLAYLKDMPKLNKIVIKNIESLDTFPDLSKLKTLRTLELYDLPRLYDISNFAMLDKLETIILHSLEKLETENLLILKGMKKLTNVGIYFKNGFKTEQSKKIIKAHKSWTEIKIL